jgi:hypothetical protein
MLDGIRGAIRLYAVGLQDPEYGITATELVNSIFLSLGHRERVDLVHEVVQLLPSSAHGELCRVVDVILQPGSNYAPFTIGRPSDPVEWRRRMRPACEKLALLFREHLDRIPKDKERMET